MSLRKSLVLTFLLILFISLLAGIVAIPGHAGAMSVLPKQLYLIQDTEMYNNPWKPGKRIGVIAANQTVMVLGSDLTEASTIEDDIQWFKIQTWLGEKWIKADSGRMIGGTLDKQAQTLTSVSDITLYNRPDQRYSTNIRISPQNLHVVASFHITFWHFTNATDLIMGVTDTWYQIETWLGQKWIFNPEVLEVVKETQVSYSIKLTGQETVYPYPFVIEASAQIIEPQVVQVVAEWKAGFGPYEVIWIKVILPEGERWLAPSNQVIKDYRKEESTVTLPTKKRYLVEPDFRLYNGAGLGDSTLWLDSGKYEAYEGAGDWLHIRTMDHGEVWVNPKRALLERPVGIDTVDEKLVLTKNDDYYKFPLTGEQSHVRGYYASQTVKVDGKWQAPEGVIWYHFGSGNGEWVRRTN